MDSWMPWTITCNFIRGFFPTLMLVISWDLWRNVNHPPATRRLAVLVDIMALGAVSAIRLTPPLAPAREQLKYFFRGSWIGFTGLCALAWIGFTGLGALAWSWLFDEFHATLLDGLLAAVAYAFYNDLSRVCKISREDAEHYGNFVYRAVGIAAWLTLGMVSLLKLGHGALSQGVFSRRYALTMGVLLPVLIAIAVFRWRGRWRNSAPEIQELGLNR
jgi:hypothetical protein